MIFARPLLLLLLLAIPLWWWLRLRRSPPAAVFSDSRQLRESGRGRGWQAEIPAGLRSVVLGSWIIAAAGPELGSALIDTESEGIAIVLAVDVSSSMLAEDFAPSNRLEVAIEQSVAFIGGREFDRIGLESKLRSGRTRRGAPDPQEITAASV